MHIFCLKFISLKSGKVTKEMVLSKDSRQRLSWRKSIQMTKGSPKATQAVSIKDILQF